MVGSGKALKGGSHSSSETLPLTAGSDGASGGHDEHTQMKNITFWCVLSGCCPLIPLPIVDGICEEVVRHLMVCANLKMNKIDQDLKGVHTLSSREACTRAECAMKVGYYVCGCFLLEFCCKKLCFCLTVKQCVENASELFHQAWLLNYAVKVGHLSKNTLHDRVATWRLSEAINHACGEVETKPIEHVFKDIMGNNKGVMQETAGIVKKSIEAHGVTVSGCKCSECCVSSREREAVKEALEGVQDETREGLSSLVSSASQKIEKESAYLRQLEGVYMEHYRALHDEDAQPPMCCF